MEKDRRIEDNTTQDVKNHFRPKKDIGDNIWNLFRRKTKMKGSKTAWSEITEVFFN